MAKAFLQTCPNDWCSGYSINTKGVLHELIQGIKQSETTSSDVNPVAMMRFRWRAARDADNLVAYFQLPVPDGQCCLMWDMHYSLEERKSRIPDYSDKYILALHFILGGPISPEPIENLEGYPFPRVAQYIATAVAMADLSSEKQDELLNRMSDFVLKERKTWAESNVQIAGRKRDIAEAQGTDLLL
ncbi:hypothetical protein NLU13_9167 [Sarocladium strictum]|uniref:Uncharacterized protein n=1 Tax=Sarocladium strictum TaxID=5046 RepID=A0AA39L463_SARSR|nr:hypothetical protein NLU13_9167 [Sarocladium strictum]